MRAKGRVSPVRLGLSHMNFINLETLVTATDRARRTGRTSSPGNPSSSLRGVEHGVDRQQSSPLVQQEDYRSQLRLDQRA